MSTITTGRAETRSIAIGCAPARVHAFIAEPRNLPRWAPAFARTVRADGPHWIVDSGAGEARIAVVASPAHGTVDLLAPGEARGGAFLRVVPNGRGSELLFTLTFPPTAADDAVERQMATVQAELDAVRELCERAT